MWRRLSTDGICEPVNDLILQISIAMALGFTLFSIGR
jgi:hypothetical protein